MIALIEQNQQEDGTIKIPSALQPYMNGMEVIDGSLNKLPF
jgi:seryl-tRNA synthetase